MEHDHDGMLRRGKAVERMLTARQTLLTARSTETVALGKGINGRVLAQRIDAERDVPAFDHATMDGYALNTSDDYPLDIVGTGVFPESEPLALEVGQAIRTATGAPIPERANAVLKKEAATIEDGRLDGVDLEPGTFIYERASNVTAGETLFETHERLSAKDATLLRDLGIETVVVHKPLSVALLATGTEIHEDRIADLDSPMVAELVQSWGHKATYVGTVPDEYDRIRARIAELSEAFDVVITTGGTSVGEKDYVVRALESLGKIIFHRARVRPGKPIALAELSNATAIAVPGKPIGAYTIMTLIVRPFFTGETTLPTVHAEMTDCVDIGSEDFEYAIPVLLSGKTATPLGHVDSPLSIYETTFDPSVLSASTRATRADGFLITNNSVKRGETVPVVPYEVVE